MNLMAIQMSASAKLYLIVSVSTLKGGRMGGLASSNGSTCPSLGFENTLVMHCYFPLHAQHGISDAKVATYSMHPTFFMLYGIIQHILFYVVCTTHTVLFVPYLVANQTHSALIARAPFACYLPHANQSSFLRTTSNARFAKNCSVETARFYICCTMFFGLSIDI